MKTIYNNKDFNIAQYQIRKLQRQQLIKAKQYLANRIDDFVEVLRTFEAPDDKDLAKLYRQMIVKEIMNEAISTREATSGTMQMLIEHN